MSTLFCTQDLLRRLPSVGRGPATDTENRLGDWTAAVIPLAPLRMFRPSVTRAPSPMENLPPELGGGSPGVLPP